MQQTQNPYPPEQYTKPFLMIFESGNSITFLSYYLVKKIQNGFVAYEKIHCAVQNNPNWPKTFPLGANTTVQDHSCQFDTVLALSTRCKPSFFRIQRADNAAKA